MRTVFLIAFGMASVIELLAHLLNLPDVRLISKPSLLLLLTAWYVVTARHENQPISKMVLAALIFSWGGDVLLMGDSDLYFMLGLGSFLLAHVFYIFVFRQFCNEDQTNSLQGLKRIRFAFPIVLFGTGLMIILYPTLGNLAVPVLLYAGVLTLMVLNALFRFGRTTSSSFAYVFGGGILFMISDSVLAINKFLEPVNHAGIWIMLTYIVAQFLIVKGLLKHD
ncbi:MAG: lysoplasmalogenase [Cyclobacteriaceae bacterium]|nr:lysoplasmalogenase [Cyclobacteriaceae bacterium]